MQGHVAVFRVAKSGATLNECEDAACHWPKVDGGDFDEASIRVAVADGASESLLAGPWARCLSETFVAEGGATKEVFIRGYGEALQSWDASMAGYRDKRAAAGSPVQWYEEPGLERGAYSTLAFAEILDKGRHLYAAAIGDSCVFQIRNEALILAFPLSDPELFTSQPPLLPSRRAPDVVVSDNLVCFETEWQSGDGVFLMTDALSAWFLRRCAAGDRPWSRLRDLDEFEPSDFADWVSQLRSATELRDDDTTLVRVDLY